MHLNSLQVSFWLWQIFLNDKKKKLCADVLFLPVSLKKRGPPKPTLSLSIIVVW